MKKIIRFKFKLWQKSLIAFAISSSILGSSVGFLYLLKKNETVFNHSSSRSLKNNLNDFRDFSKYKFFLQDPTTENKIDDYNPENDTVGGVDFKKWLFDYQKRYKKNPVLVIRGGPIEFQNNYLEVIFPQTFLSFVKWFSEEIPWGADLSSLSSFKILKGIKRTNYTITLGDYSADKLIRKRIQFFPDSFFRGVSSKKFLMKLFKDTIEKAEIPALIRSINYMNKQFQEKYKEDWKNYAIKLYSLEKIGNKYRPIIVKAADIIYKIEEESPLQIEKVSDVDVVLGKDGISVKVVNQDSYKIKYDKEIPKLQVWKSLFAHRWEGFSFEFLKYLTHHEYAHMQTLGFAQSSANSYVGLGVPSTSPNSFSKPYDFDELNRYLKARVPQIRALRVSSNFHKDKQGWDWNYYEDRLKDWQNGILKIKPDPRDFDQVAFEYRPTGEEKWTRESAEKVFGSPIDPTNSLEAPYQVDPDEFRKKIDAGERPRFFAYSIRDAREFARVTKIPLSALYIMNAFDSLPATKNPKLKTYFARYDSLTKKLWYYFARKIQDMRNNYGRYLSNRNDYFNYPIDVLINLNAYNGVKLLLKAEKNFKGPTLNVRNEKYKINPLARSKEGKLLKNNSEKVFSLIKEVLSNARFKFFNGNEDILSRSSKIGNADEEITFDLAREKNFNPNLAEWKEDKNKKSIEHQSNLLPEKYKTIFSYDKKTINANWKFNNIEEPKEGEKYEKRSTYDKEYVVTKVQVKDKKGNIHNIDPKYARLYYERFYYDFKEKKWIWKEKTSKEISFPISQFQWLLRYIQSLYTHRDRTYTIISKELNNPYPKRLLSILNWYFGKGNIPWTLFKEIPWWKNRRESYLRPKNYKVYYEIDKKALQGIEEPKINQFVVKVKIKGFVKPSDKLGDHPDRDRQLLKWLKSVSNAGSASSINDSFSNYFFSYSEVLARDWVAITQSVHKPYRFKYPSKWFPIGHKNFGIERFFDPSEFLDYKFNNTNTTYKEVLSYKDWKDTKENQKLIEYKKDFVRSYYDYLMSAQNKNNKLYQSLAKKFVPRNKVNYKDLSKYSDSLSFLNIKKIITDDKKEKSFDHYDDPETEEKENYHINYLLKSKFFNSFDTKKGWSEVFINNDGYFEDRWLRASMANARDKEGTKDSWVFYDNEGEPVPYKGNIKKLNGDTPKTRPEAYWNFFLKLRGISLRTVSAMWLHHERNAVTIWGYMPVVYKNKIKYLQFKNIKTGKITRKLIRFDVDNLFYYPESPGKRDKRKKVTLRNEGFTSWNIDYISMGNWANAMLKNGQYQMDFIDKDGKIIEVEWNGRRLAMTGNSESQLKNKKHILSLNWFDKSYAPAYIQQNEKGQNILYVKNSFPV